jgi:hypothetical protein
VVILWPVFRAASEQKQATGVDVFAAPVFSPVSWILVVLFFVLFFAASRIGNKLLKTFLFWIPTVLLSSLGVAIFALFTYIFIFIRLKHP